MLKTFLQHIAVVLCKKRLQKTAYIGELGPFLKVVKNDEAEAITFAKCSLGSKIENANKHANNVSTTHCSCSVQKTSLKKR